MSGADASAGERPDVFVMNLYYTGLGIARCLEGRGVRVVGLSSEDDAPGARSSLFAQVLRVPSSRDEPKALVGRLLELVQEGSVRPMLFPTRDADVLFLHDNRELLESRYLLPPLDAVPMLLDKFELAKLAVRANVRAPATVVCNNDAELELAAATLKFPIVVKPRSANEWRKNGIWEKVGARKALMVSSPEELRAEYEMLRIVSPELLLQEFVPGEDADIVVCCCYVGRSGELLGYFTGRKLRQNPPLFGTGCVVEAADVPGIIAPTKRLLGACGYTGFAEVEYKLDRRTGEFFLIEVNPRHWDQHELGRLVGVNLTALAYGNYIGAKVVKETPRYPDGKLPRWIAEREAVLLLARNTYLASRRRTAPDREGNSTELSKFRIVVGAARDLFSLFSGPNVYALWRLTDPRPGAGMLRGLAGDLHRSYRNTKVRPVA